MWCKSTAASVLCSGSDAHLSPRAHRIRWEQLRLAFTGLSCLSSTIADMDRIVCMERGEIVEVGTPDELLADSKGVFAELSKLDE